MEHGRVDPKVFSMSNDDMRTWESKLRDTISAKSQSDDSIECDAKAELALIRSEAARLLGGIMAAPGFVPNSTTGLVQTLDWAVFDVAAERQGCNNFPGKETGTNIRSPPDKVGAIRDSFRWDSPDGTLVQADFGDSGSWIYSQNGLPVAQLTYISRAKDPQQPSDSRNGVPQVEFARPSIVLGISLQDIFEEIQNVCRSTLAMPQLHITSTKNNFEGTTILKLGEPKSVSLPFSRGSDQTPELLTEFKSTNSESD
jgi:hypothetical protein